MAERTVKVRVAIDEKDTLRGARSAEDAMSRLGRSVQDTDRKIKDTFKPGPIMRDFRAGIQKEAAELARLVNVAIPVTPQTDRLRAQMERRLAEIESTLDLEIPVEPSGRREYELALRAMVDAASSHVKAHIKTEVEPASVAAFGAAIGTKAGMEAGSTFATRFAGASSAAMPAVISAITTSLLPLSSVASGLLLTGLGAGVLGGGVAAAFQDPRVKGAAAELGRSVLSDLGDAASVFVEPLQRSFLYLSLVSKSLKGELSGVFAQIEPYLGKIVTGLGELVAALLPGLQRGLEGAAPMLDALAQWLPELGSAIGDFFAILSEDGARTASNFRATLYMITGAIRNVAEAIRWLSSRFNDLIEMIGVVIIGWGRLGELLFKIIPGLKLAATVLGLLTDEQADYLDRYKNGVGDAADATKGLTGGLGLAGGAMSAAQVRTEALNKSLQEQIDKGRTLSQVWNDINGVTLAGDRAMLAASEKLKEIKQGWIEHGRAIDGNSEAALKNRIAIAEYLDIANQIYDANIAQGRGTDVATAAYGRYIQSLVAAMRQAGYTDAQIQTLLDSVNQLPQERTITVKADDQVSFQVAEMENSLNALTANPRYVTIRASYDIPTMSAPTESLNPRGRTRDNRWGGLYEAAAWGTLREAQVYSPTHPGRYMIAEPQTRGEAFIPKSGDYGRSMSILSRAAGWYGAQVVPGGAGGGGSQEFVGSVALILDGEQIHNSQVRFRRRTGRG